MWDVTQCDCTEYVINAISTHTSRVGCDVSMTIVLIANRISTHTSRVGCDTETRLVQINALLFLLTHPVWDVTFALLAFK